jgi:hypothetical protein
MVNKIFPAQSEHPGYSYTGEVHMADMYGIEQTVRILVISGNEM